MQPERSPEKLKIGVPNEEEKEKISLPSEEIARDVQKILDERRISPEELPNWLKDLVKEREEMIKVERRDDGRDIRLFLLYPEEKEIKKDTIIRIRVKNLEKPKVEIKITKKGKEIPTLFYPKEELAEKIIKATGILGIVEKGERWVVLKEGRGRAGFKYIKKKRFWKFKKKLGIETEEELQEMILRSVKEAQSLRYEAGKKVYQYQTEKGVWIETSINPYNYSIIDSYPE